MRINKFKDTWPNVYNHMTKESQLCSNGSKVHRRKKYKKQKSIVNTGGRSKQFSVFDRWRMCPLFYVSFNLYSFLYLCKFVWSFGLSYFCLTYFHYLFVYCHLFTWINDLFYSSMVLHFIYMEVIGFRRVVWFIRYP